MNLNIYFYNLNEFEFLYKYFKEMHLYIYNYFHKKTLFSIYLNFILYFINN
jgi:hypothetical protein